MMIMNDKKIFILWWIATTWKHSIDTHVRWSMLISKTLPIVIKNFKYHYIQKQPMNLQSFIKNLFIMIRATMCTIVIANLMINHSNLDAFLDEQKKNSIQSSQHMTMILQRTITMKIFPLYKWNNTLMQKWKKYPHFHLNPINLKSNNGAKYHTPQKYNCIFHHWFF